MEKKKSNVDLVEHQGWQQPEDGKDVQECYIWKIYNFQTSVPYILRLLKYSKI